MRGRLLLGVDGGGERCRLCGRRAITAGLPGLCISKCVKVQGQRSQSGVVIKVISYMNMCRVSPFELLTKLPSDVSCTELSHIQQPSVLYPAIPNPFVLTQTTVLMVFLLVCFLFGAILHT